MVIYRIFLKEVLKMTLRHLKIFIEVCNQNSITAAAKKLYIAQPAISQAIKELENCYHVKLFDRLSNKIFLTEVGQKVFFHAKDIMAHISDMEQSIRDISKTEVVRVGASITLGTHYMPEYVSFFKNEHSDARIKVYINNSKIIEERILTNELDFAVIEGTVHSPVIKCEKFMSDRLEVICCPSHPLLICKKVTINQLLEESFLLREKGSGTRELFDMFISTLGVNIIPLWESSSTNALINGVAKGIGISILPHHLVKSYIEAGTICKLKVENIKLIRNYYIIHYKNKHLSTLQTAFIDMVKTFQLNTIEQFCEQNFSD